MAEIIAFDLQVKSQTIHVKDLDGQTKEYTISELSGAEMETYMESMNDRVTTTVDEKGNTKTALKSFKGMYASLLSLCLQDNTGTLVSSDRIQKFPTSVQKGMFEIAQNLNGLSEKAVEKAKN